MPELISPLLDSTRLLFDLQRANEIAQRFSGCLEPEAIAHRTTDGLVELFNCAFSRIWLVEPDQSLLRLVASSGLYSRINGSFARVPMGAYKVGKIAQNRVSFLSNNLAQESWVKDREWAIANRIRGFAGFPLTVGDRVIGVLATFSHDPLAPEFLEVLQVLCTMVSVALDTALRYQREKPEHIVFAANPEPRHPALSDQLAAILGSVRFTLIGTEHPLSLVQTYVFLQLGEGLNRLGCRYCRLFYQESSIRLEAIVTAPDGSLAAPDAWVRSQFGQEWLITDCLGGSLQGQAVAHQSVIQISLQLPYPGSPPGRRLRIYSRFPMLQQSLTHLALAAGLQVWDGDQEDIPLLTDDPRLLSGNRQILWVRHGQEPVPPGVKVSIDLSSQPAQLHQAIAALTSGETWGLEGSLEEVSLLSEREREILRLLADGLRDRDIANQLIISESTVKFHINNVVSKLKARTRFQALYQVMKKGWL